ncbi:TolC family protein [Desulforamulus aeronauticus]|uniref:Outer membrane efflux protein n=1 Tax=Desulforamulus aeronauticus DSM 10349 TaxID=1121421 RepID=A0A1M6T442_9FIRM|nr:TolC family protein [Desulforamulus aeronauticus]SHK51659.1 Outer membrane efflux protein [Desulforamulus aeronauticus DSM 10349]
MTKKMLTVVVTVLLLLLQSLPAMAEQSAEELSLNQALQKALTRSIALRNTQLDIDKLEISRDNASFNMNGIVSGYNILEDSIMATHKTFFEADINYRLSEKRLDEQKKQIKAEVTGYYYSILLAEQDFNIAKEKFALDMIKNSQVASKYKVGMATQLELLTSENQLKEDKKDIEEKTNALTKAYTAFNKAIGNEQNARPVLIDKINYTPVEELDVETMVLKAVNNSYEVWAQQEKAKKASYVKYYETFYDIGDYNEAQEKNTLADTKEAIRLQARGYCLDIIDNQKNYAQYEIKEKQLEESLKMATVKYEVGLATKDELDTIKLGLNQTKLAKDSSAVTQVTSLLKLQRLTGDLSPTI